MPIDVVQEHDGIAEVVIDHPPVNALDVAAWFALADAMLAAGRVPTNRVVVLRAIGRGFWRLRRRKAQQSCAARPSSNWGSRTRAQSCPTCI